MNLSENYGSRISGCKYVQSLIYVDKRSDSEEQSEYVSLREVNK